MNKHAFTLLLVLFGSVYGRAQKPGPYSFSLNGHQINSVANVAAVKQAYKEKKNKNNTTDYLILQFEKIPNVKEQQLLEAKGVRLLDYISNNAYFSQITPSFYVATSGTEKLRSVIEIKPEYKVNKNLKMGAIPNYAKGKSGEAKVVITYFEPTPTQQIVDELKALGIRNYRLAPGFHQVYATIKFTSIDKIAALKWVQYLELIAPPKTIDNLEGRTMHKANILNSKALGIGYGLTGKGVTLGLWDTDVEQPRDFSDRLVCHEFEWHHPHGTHVFGTIAGAGIVDPYARGMAPETVIHSWNFGYESNNLSTPEERELAVKNLGIELTSNSWGYQNTSCPNPFDYNAEDRAEDMVAHRYPYFLYVFSSGNDQASCANGYKTTSKNLKNSLVVAAINKNNEMSNFSSFGPSFDGRLIPNISGDGVHVYSNVYDNKYDYYDGTSMATPGVAGTMALLYQRYKETHAGSRPLSAMMRALVMNTAEDFGNPGPDYQFGYGAINGVRAIEVMERNQYLRDSLANGATFTKNIILPAGAVGLRVMLAWTDREGTPGAAKILVNDLDLKIMNGTNTTLPWILNPANPSDNAVRGVDSMNNMEQVTLDNPLAGNYTISVNAKSVPQGKQEFAIVYEIVMPQIKITYPIGGESFNPDAHEIIRWDCQGYNKPFTLEYSIDNGVNYSILASNISSDKRSFEWMIPHTSVANAKFRLSSGSAMTVSNGSFSIEHTPMGLTAPPIVCGTNSYNLTWDSVPNATYKVYKLNYQTFEFLGNASSNNYTLSSIMPSRDNYYCVKAVDKTTGAISERSLAVWVGMPMPIALLPFGENFNHQKADNFYMNQKNGKVSTKMFAPMNNYALVLEGPYGPLDSSWDGSATTAAQVFSINPEYQVSAGICKFDATAYAGKKILFQFDYRQKYRSAPGSSLFRLKVNGNYVKNTDSVDIYGSTPTPHYQTVVYDISAYAGNPTVAIEMEGVFETNYNDGMEYMDDQSDFGDFVGIDNVKISQMVPDAAITNLQILGGLTASDTVTIIIRNLSPNSIVNIPVSYKVNSLPSVIDTLKTSIASLGSTTFSFKQNINLSADGIDTVVATVHLLADSNSLNNSKTEIVYVDKMSIRMGNTPGAATCGGFFTDAGGSYLPYGPDEYTTFTLSPDTLGKNSRVTFTEFDIENEYEYLWVYDGPSTSAPLIGEYTGNNLPPMLTSSAAGGELTFEFYSDGGLQMQGWKANISCVNKPNIDMATLVGERTGSLDSSVMKITVKNNGVLAIGSYNIYYQVNNNPAVQQTISSSLSAFSNATHSFNVKANLSGALDYQIKFWVKATGDANLNNDTSLITLANYVDASIEVYDILPYRSAKTEIAGIIHKMGDASIDTISIAYRINGGTAVIDKLAWPAGESQMDFFFGGIDLTATNAYQIKVYTLLPQDIDHSNDTLATTVIKPANSPTNVVATFKNREAMLVIPPIPATNLRNNFTVECWTKLGRNTVYGRIFEKGSFRLYYGIEETAYPENSLILNVNNGSGGFTFFYPGVIKENQWQHVAVSLSNGNVYKLYVDGIEQTPILYSGAPGNPGSNAGSPLFIGNRASMDRAVDGFIDEIRIWNAALSQTKIQSNMNTDIVVGLADSNLMGYYKLKEGSQNWVFDYSVNDNTAIIMGADVSGIGAGKFWNNPGPQFDHVAIPGQRMPSTFNASNNTYSIVMRNANLSNLSLHFASGQNSVIKVGTTIQTSGLSANNFTGNVTYTATGIGFNTGINETYVVNVTNEIVKDSVCDLNAFWFDSTDNAGKPQMVLLKNGSTFQKKVVGVNTNSLKARFTIPTTAKLFLNGILQTSPQTMAIDYSKPVLVSVIAEDGVNMKNYAIVLDSRSNRAVLSTFNIPMQQIGNTTMDTVLHAISVTVKPNSNVNMLAPEFTTSPNAKVYVGSIQQLSGLTNNNYTVALGYKVVSEDESNMVDWMVTVSKQILASNITVTGAAGASTISTKAGTLQMNAAVLPANASFKNVSWSVSNGTGSATISPTGLLMAVTDGTVMVKAKATDSSNVEGSMTVTISNQTVGIAKLNSNTVKVYPNPASNLLYVERQIASEVYLRVYDLLGNTLMEKRSDGLLQSIDIAELKSGVYFVSIKNNQQETYTVKFIKE